VIRFLAGTSDFSLLNVPGAYPASCSVPAGNKTRGALFSSKLISWSYTSTFPYSFLLRCLVKHSENFTFTITFGLV
jgi:hypothetical protein